MVLYHRKTSPLVITYYKIYGVDLFLFGIYWVDFWMI